MTSNADNSVGHRWDDRSWSRPILLTALLAELLLFWALKIELWRKTGLGWLFAAIVGAAVLAVVAASVGIREFIRRRFQFTLKAMLLLVLLVAAALGFLERTRKQRRAAAILTDLGVGIQYEGEDDPGLRALIGRKYFHSPIAMFAGGSFRGSDLSHIEALTDLHMVMLASPNVSDDDLRHLAPLTQLNTLALIGARIRGHGFAHVARLPLLDLSLARSRVNDDALAYFRFSQLHSLNLNQTRIGDAGLARISTMPELTSLYLESNRITDAGLAHVAQISTLEELSLDWNNLTDAGLVHLTSLKRLRSLHLRGTWVTEAGIAKLKRAIPDCEIVSDY